MVTDIINEYTEILGPDAEHTGLIVKRKDHQGVLIIRGIGLPLSEKEIKEAFDKLIGFYKSKEEMNNVEI